MSFSEISSRQFKENLEQTVKLFQENANDDFAKSIQYIERFQVQNELEKLYSNAGMEKRNRIDIFENLKKLLDIQTSSSVMKEKEYLYANSVSQLIKYIDMSIDKITDKDIFEPVWFRGHSSCDFKLIPSLYRIKNKESKFYKNVKLREVINPLFKSFKVKAFGAKEIYAGGDDSRIGILASMQHYSVPTNILDWTPAAFVALYFAVEDYMVYNEQEKRVRRRPEKAAELWLLNPGRLNQARDILTSRRIDPATEMYPIPSFYDNEEDYKEYLPFSLQEEPYNLPIAVYVPHTNQRIKAQLGTFTMFSLDATGRDSDDGESVYFKDMVEVQNDYKEEKEYKPFLTSVRLSPKCVIEVADWLRSMGVTKPMVYPELNNISEVLTGEIKDYCNRKEGKK